MCPVDVVRAELSQPLGRLWCDMAVVDAAVHNIPEVHDWI